MGIQQTFRAEQGVAEGSSADQRVAGPLSALTQTVAGLAEGVRDLQSSIRAAATDTAVQMRDLARLIETLNDLARAASGLEAQATAAFARRDEVYDAADPFAPPRQVVRGRGFVHEHADLELSHLVAITEGSAFTRVRRAAAMDSRLPLTLAAVTAGDLELWQAQQVLEECQLLDDEEARAVDAWIAPRLRGTDPARIRTKAKYAVSRTDPDKVRKRAARSRADRTVEITPALEPGLSQVYALIPSHQAAAIWEAASVLGKQYQELDPGLTADQARADALVDLVLADVDVRASITLGMPVITSATSAVGDAHVRHPDPAADKAPEDLTTEDLDRRFGPEPDPPPDLPGWPAPASHDPNHADPASDPGPQDSSAPSNQADPPDSPDESERPAPGFAPIERDPGGPDNAYEGPGTVPDRIPDWMLAPDQPLQLTAPIHGGGPLAGTFTSGVTVPKVGYIPADVIAALLERLDLTVARALIDAADGTLRETVTDAYRPNRALKDFVYVRDGMCRMFGCTRPAVDCDLDHATPHDRNGPTAPGNLAGLCRHHHRAKQARHWLYSLDPKTGVATWVNRRTGTIRSTHPATALAADALTSHVLQQPETLSPVAPETLENPGEHTAHSAPDQQAELPEPIPF